MVAGSRLAVGTVPPAKQRQIGSRVGGWEAWYGEPFGFAGSG